MEDIMSKFVVVIFPDEARAYEGTQALKDLHAEGSITVYGMAVIGRDAKGIGAVKQTETQGPLGMAVGSLLGGFVGMFGGPVGAAVGISYGAVIGGLTDMFNAGVGGDFVRTVSEKLTPGKSAVVSEVTEDWVTPLDTRMEAIGGFVLRESRSDFEDEQIEKEVNARKAELSQLRDELKHANAEGRANLQARIAETEAKLKSVSERAQQRMHQLQEEAQAKVQELQNQATKAKSEAKSRVNRLIAEMRAEDSRRYERLKEIWDQAKKDLAA